MTPHIHLRSRKFLHGWEVHNHSHICPHAPQTNEGKASPCQHETLDCAREKHKGNDQVAIIYSHVERRRTTRARVRRPLAPISPNVSTAFCLAMAPSHCALYLLLLTWRTKHTDTQYFGVQERVQEGDLSIKKVPAAKKCADVGTKSVSAFSLSRN